ncbi:MAG: TetR family transcriptional regulator [Treponema sp.]|jgi:AcrR family transcriptional regulator|nr:TetR family transcriptional regulator [Treponema sp.]
MLHKPNHNNRQVQRTRKWIFEALMILIAEQPYHKITVSDIIKRAGIARQTFYRNYKNKDEVMIQYLKDSFTSNSFNMVDTSSKSNIQDIVITVNLNYLLEHRKDLVLIMKIPGIENIFSPKLTEWQNLLLDNYKRILSHENYVLFRYTVKYQLIGYLQVISDWFNNGMPIKAEKLNSILNKLTVPSRLISGGIPNININIKA